MQLKRLDGQPRVPVYVDEQLNVPGLPPMDLAGVVYHHGEHTSSGHYTCLCRGPRGSFFYYDDEKEPVHENQEVGHVKPRAVYLVAYCRRGGVAEYAERPPDVGNVVDLVGDVDMEAAAGVAAAAASPAPAGAASGTGGAAASVAVVPAAAAAPAPAAAPAAAPAPAASRGRAGGMGGTATSGASRIVTGFGAERIDDLRAHDAETEADALERHARRASEGDRGRVRDMQDRDLDRSAGGPFRAGRR